MTSHIRTTIAKHSNLMLHYFFLVFDCHLPSLEQFTYGQISSIDMTIARPP